MAKPDANDMQAQLLGYLRGELSDDERYELENGPLQTAGVADTLQELAQNQTMIPAIEEDLKDISRRWQAPQAVAPQHRGRQWQLVLAVAASLLVGALTYGYYQSQQSNRLYAESIANVQADDYLAVRGNDAASPALKTAISAFESANYTASLLQFQALRETNPFDAQVLLYTGLSAMQVGEYYRARQAFDQLLAIDVPEVDRAAAHWYLALVYLKQEQSDKSRQELEWLMKNDRGVYQAKAAELLEEL